MIKSIFFQIKSMGQYYGFTLLACFVCIPYAMLLSSSNQATILIFRSCAYMITAVFLWVFPQSYYGIYTPLALAYGATRRGWFKSALINQVLYALVPGATLFFLADPLAQRVFGHTGTYIWPLAPFLLCACLFLVCFGTMLGFISARYGIKYMLLVMFPVLLVLGAGVIIALIRSSISSITFTISGTTLPLVLVALCAVTQIVIWRCVRGLAVKG